MQYLQNTIPGAYALLEQIIVKGACKRAVEFSSLMFLLKHYLLASEIYKSEENNQFHTSRNSLSSGIIVSTAGVQYYRDNRKFIRVHTLYIAISLLR